MFAKINALLVRLFGDFTWAPPPWLLRFDHSATGWMQTHRRTTLGVGLGAVAAFLGALVAWEWYEHQPKPHTVSVDVEAPGLTVVKDNREVVQSLWVKFGESVIPLTQSRSDKSLPVTLNPKEAPSTPHGKKDASQFLEQYPPITEGVRIDPPIPGTWRWAGERRLQFTPKSDWPADTKYRVKLDKSLFPKDVLLARYELETTTPAFSVNMSVPVFYTDPQNPIVKQVTTTLEFTHHVSLAEVEKHVQLSVIGGAEIFAKDKPQLSVTPGKHERTVYLRTSALTLPEDEDFLRITLEKGVATTQGGALTKSEVERKIKIPNLYSFFKITKSYGTIVYNNEGEPEQILIVETRGAAKSAEIQKALHVYLLPKKEKKKDRDEAEWKSAKEIDEEILSDSTLLPVKLLPSDKENTEFHSFKISLESEGQQLLVTVDKGVKALGGFVLGDEYRNVLPTPEIPREITIEGEGGVLALNGERKLSIKSRGVKTIEYEVARVPADQINHLVSQTRGEFQNPEFVNYHFGRENIARIATEKQEIHLQGKFKANASAFDFSKYLKPLDENGTPMQGLFFLRAREWKEPKKKEENKEEAARDDNDGRDESDEDDGLDETEQDDAERGDTVGDERFILVTDLGMIVKETADGSRDVYLASIKTGQPLGGVTVDVLAKNGVPLVSGKTETDGRVLFASLGKPVREKQPVAFVARLGSDVAFMPYARRDRQLDFSKFDVGGVESRSGSELDAFVFTERGIYRPGDQIRIGLIVKQRDWAGKLDGLPIEVEVTDPEDDSVQIRKLALPAMGFAETSYQTAYGSRSGSYTISAYIVRHGKRDLLLGEASVIVKEFLPDRMKIESRLSTETKAGWISPADVSAAITLRNLYGTPATGRRIKSHIVLSPAGFQFEEFPGYRFYDRLRKENEELKTQKEDLGEETTDDNGAATVKLNLERFAGTTYSMRFAVEGFEADGGRSVSTGNNALVSDQPYVIGAKEEGDFSYIKMGTPRSVEWIALDSTLKKIAVDNLECRLTERVYVSVLSKQDNGNYAYESVQRDHVVRTEPLSIGDQGMKYALPTDVPGTFVLELFEKESVTRVSRVEFCVVGRGAVSRSLEKNAELQVKLSRPSYNTGEEIEIAIVAPYTGSGLITIERDKVYAHTWFKADRTSTVQHIRVPADFEGTGYVNVCFVRGLDSKEVFMSPLSYATVPFRANLEKRRLPITLLADKKHLPGEPLRIGYKTDRPARIAIFAVDQGILQVSDYQLPEPLTHFFRKAALMVQTKQIVDLILPEFSLLRQASAFGGDGEKHLNPFKRVTEKPVVFWSGIVDAGPREQEVVYDVPDYFSGTLTIMAVAVAPDAVGSTQMNSLVRGPFVLTPNVPVVAAPGDQFEVSVAIANGVEGSGASAQVRVRAEPSEHLEIVKKPDGSVPIPEGREVTATFTVRAREKLGSASLVFHADLPGQSTKLRSTLSVRPPVPFMTSVRSGNFNGSNAEMKVDRAIHPDFRKLDATISAVPLGLARGLDIYLKNYPNGCTEQLTSGAFCRLTLAEEADFGLSRGQINAQLERTFDMLRRRQNDQGSFGYWTVEKGGGIDFVSVYVMHMLIEAKASGFAPPASVLQSGMQHLHEMVALDPSSLHDARIIAYAIYLLTREGVVTTNYILNLRDYLDSHYAKQWQGDLAGVYLAGAYALLKKQDEGQKLIKSYKLGGQKTIQWSDFHSQLGSDSQYVSIAAAHFPDTLKKITAADFEKITQPIGRGDFSTLSAAYAVLALKSYSRHLTQNAPELGMSEFAARKETPLRLEGGALMKRATFSPAADKLRFTAKNQAGKIGVFFQMVEAGYDMTLPSEALADGLEIFRELVDEAGNPTQTAKLGDPITVRLRMRSKSGATLTNVAIVDLLPGGFEFAAGSLEPGAGSHGFDFVEVREDRAVFFGTVGPRVREVRYQIKPTNRGEYVVPPAFAESMYDRSIKARALAGRVTVTP
jgi:uncharacterized repeat protein (TIGR01451 family)